MKWENDRLKIYFPKHKSDQIGLDKEEARHIYSNPEDPVVCPLQALASYFYLQIFINAKKSFLVAIKRKYLTVVCIESCTMTLTSTRLYFLILKKLDIIQYAKAMQYIAVLVFILTHQYFQYVYKLDGPL